MKNSREDHTASQLFYKLLIREPAFMNAEMEERTITEHLPSINLISRKDNIKPFDLSKTSNHLSCRPLTRLKLMAVQA